MKRWRSAAATLMAFGAAGLAVAFWPERTDKPARPVPSLSEGSFDTLEVVAKGTSTAVTRDSRGDAAADATVFVASAGAGHWPADATAARAAFTALEGLEWVARVTARPTRHAELQVDEAQAVRVRARRADHLLVELLVGKAAGGGTFVRVAGDDQVWRVGGELRGTFDRSTAEWRDPYVTRFDPDKARELAIATRDGAHLVVRRKPDELAGVHAGVPGFGGLSHARWELLDSSVPIDRLDQQVPREMVATLSALQASGFADGLSPAATGLDPGALTVRVTFADDGANATPAVTVAIGKEIGAGERFVKVLDAAQIFRVQGFAADRLDRRPIQFRDKTLCDISEDNLVAFGVARAGGSYAVERRSDAWRATRPSGMLVDPEKVKPLASVFRAWTAPTIAEIAEIAEDPGPRATGRPQMIITGKSKDRACRLSAWASGPDYLVRTATSADVYVVPKVMVDRIAVPLDSLRRTAAETNLQEARSRRDALATRDRVRR